MSRIVLLGISLALCWTLVPEFAQGQNFLGKNLTEWTAELEKGNTAARRGAAFALGKLGAPSAVSVLKKALRNDSDEWVREACACALGEIFNRHWRFPQDSELLPFLADTMHCDKKGVTKENPDGSLHVRRAAAYALGCLGSDARPMLSQLREAALTDKSPAVRQNAAWALGRLGPPALDALKNAMEDADPLVKRDAAGSLEKWAPEEVRPALSELVRLCQEDKKLSPANNSEVRRAALIVLIKAVNPEDQQYIADILVALADPDEEIRNYAALTVGNIGGNQSAEATPQLLKALTQKSNPELRRQAAAALRNIGPPAKDAVPALIEALGEADADLRKNAAVALGGIGENTDGKRPDAALNAREAYYPLLKMLENTSEKDQARVEAAHAMSRMGQFPAIREAVPRLLKILGASNQSPDVRERVVWALRVHTVDLRTMDGIIPAFSQVLTEDKTKENKMLRYDCAYMLGMLQRDKVDPLTLDTLQEFLEDTGIGIYDKKKARVTGAGVDAPKGDFSVEELGKGDGRVMAAQALEVIGADTVRRHKGIVTELRKLANSRDTYRDLRKMCEALLVEMDKR